MPPLTENTVHDYQVGEKEAYPVSASVTIFEGAAVGIALDLTGYARPLQAGDRFVGFAEFMADNSAGTPGANRVEVRKKGNIVLDVIGADILANNRPAVYASADDTFTLTELGNSKIGYVSRWISGTQCVVEFDATGV